MEQRRSRQRRTLIEIATGKCYNKYELLDKIEMELRNLPETAMFSSGFFRGIAVFGRTDVIVRSTGQSAEASFPRSRQNRETQRQQSRVIQVVSDALCQIVQDVPEGMRYPSVPEAGNGDAPVFRSQEKKAEYYHRMTGDRVQTPTRDTCPSKQCPCRGCCQDGPCKNCEAR